MRTKTDARTIVCLTLVSLLTVYMSAILQGCGAQPVLEARAMARQLGETLMTVLQHPDVPVLIAKGERTRLERILICTAAGEPGKSDVRVGGEALVLPAG